MGISEKRAKRISVPKKNHALVSNPRRPMPFFSAGKKALPSAFFVYFLCVP